MKKLFNGNEINKENIIKMIEECSNEKWKGSDLCRESEYIFEKMLLGYDGIDEDFEYIIEKLDNHSNLQDVESVIKDEEWNFGKWSDFSSEI